MILALIEATGADVPRETFDKLQEYGRLIVQENALQNLVSRHTLPDLWSRHLVDSAQLLRFAPPGKRWLDIGSGAGLPGLVLAILGVKSITLVEPRRLRTEFLTRCVEQLELTNVRVITGKVEYLTNDRFDVITARAVAPMGRLFELGSTLLERDGQWVLPKGRSAAKELAEARTSWQGEFRLEPSLTDPEARILVASKVRRRAGRG